MADQKAKTSVFFTELDAILDTRMGTLLRMDRNKQCDVAEVIKAGYFTRDRDRFKNVDITAFKEAYSQRDKVTLQGSMMTPVVNLLRNFVLHTLEGNIQTPFIKEPKIVVNLYPYQLSTEEQEAIRTGLRYKVRHHEIEFVSMTYDQITPNYLKKETDLICIYDPYEWMERHSESGVFKKQSCPVITMIGPLLLKNLEDFSIDVREFQKAMEMLSKPFIDLDLIVLKTFSAAIGKDVSPPDQPKQKADTTTA